MKNIMSGIRSSFGSSDYYLAAKNESIGKGLGFVFAVAAIVGLFAGILGLVSLLTHTYSIEAEATSIASNYPDGLIMTFKDGTLTTNTNGPLVIHSLTGLTDDKSSVNAVALVPGESVNASINDKYKSAIVFASDGIVSKEDGQVKIILYKGFNQVITKDVVLQKAPVYAKKFILIASIVLIPVCVLAVLFYALFHILWLLVVAVVIYLIFQAREIPMTYKESYRLGLRAVAALLIVDIITVPLGLSGRVLSTIVILAVVCFATRTWKKNISPSL